MADGITAVLDVLGAGWLLFIGGLVVGLWFGGAAQHSRFCLRAAALEVGHGQFGEKLAIWFIAFGAAVTGIELAIASGHFELSLPRQLTSAGSLSGAILGGAIFGVGMVLARGCASRLLVLSGQGNLRSFMTGMVFAVAAAAAFRGVASPAREALGGLWIIGPDVRDLNQLLGLTDLARLAVGAAFLIAGAMLARTARVAASRGVAAVAVGLAVVAAWVFTALVAGQSFDPVPVNGITFSGPSSDVLLRVVSAPDRPVDFDTGLVPGVFLGAALMAMLTRSYRLEGFHDGQSMRRYIVGGVLMGFGAMLAGGCAVGAGVTGGMVFSLTAWATLASIWIAAILTDWIVDGRPARAARARVTPIETAALDAPKPVAR